MTNAVGSVEFSVAQRCKVQVGDFSKLQLAAGDWSVHQRARRKESYGQMEEIAGRKLCKGYTYVEVVCRLRPGVQAQRFRATVNIQVSAMRRDAKVLRSKVRPSVLACRRADGCQCKCSLQAVIE